MAIVVLESVSPNTSMVFLVGTALSWSPKTSSGSGWTWCPDLKFSFCLKMTE